MNGWKVWLVAAAVAGVYLAAWGLTVDASFTHDEAVYLDIAEQPLESTYYPEDTFLRQPPGGIGLLSVWMELGLPLRVFPVPWVLAGITLLGSAVQKRDGNPWLLAPIVALPLLAPLVSVTMYPPLFASLALAAWGWASGHRAAEVVGWNLAVLMHVLALLVLALVLLPRAFKLIRAHCTDPRLWLREIAPYPAAIAWGAIMLWGLLVGVDPRGGTVAQAADPSANAQAVMLIKPLISIGFALLLIPLARWPAIRSPGDRGWGTTVAGIGAILAAPFYRYMVALIPLLVAARSLHPTRLVNARHGGVILVGAFLLASGGVGWTTATGVDSINAADVPGLVDHDEAASLVEPGEATVLRSPPSMARVLQQDGWTVTATGPNGPSVLQLERGGQTVTLHRAETLPGLESIASPDAALVPAGWDAWITDLQTEGWTRTDQSGGLVRLSAP